MSYADYYNEKMAEYALNINEFSIGQEIYDRDNSVCKITDKAINSIEVLIPKKTNLGVTSFSWFTMKEFNNRFKK